MGRKNKVEASDHYNEIVKRLSCGESGRSVSRWLEEEHGEKISFAALNRYRNQNIKMEDRVEAELNKRQEIKNKTENEVQSQADKKENAENTVSIVAETIADNMEGVAKVAAELPDILSVQKEMLKTRIKKLNGGMLLTYLFKPIKFTMITSNMKKIILKLTLMKALES